MCYRKALPLVITWISSLGNSPVSSNICDQSCLTLCDPMDYAHQAPLSMGFPRQEY